jgi:hypothetical protein
VCALLLAGAAVTALTQDLALLCPVPGIPDPVIHALVPGTTVLFAACSVGCVGFVAEFLQYWRQRPQGARIVRAAMSQPGGAHRRTPLIEAVCQDSLPIVTTLREAVDSMFPRDAASLLSAVDSSGRTAFDYARAAGELSACDPRLLRHSRTPSLLSLTVSVHRAIQEMQTSWFR